MATGNETGALARRPLLRRQWIPLAAVVLGGAAIAIIWSVAPDHFDRGVRISVSAAIAMLALACVSAWLVFGSGLPLRVRVGYILGLMLVAALFPITVRRVDFSGDMIPSFEYRWQADRYARLEAHRASHHAANTSPDVGATQELPQPGPIDVTEYRGHGRTGMVAGPPLARDWNKQLPEPLWRQPVGGGHSAFITAGPLAFTIEQRSDEEAVVAYEIATGKERWVYQYPALFSETLGGDGPRATPTLVDGHIYSLGATGILVCLNAATGEKIWERNVFQQNAAKNLVWGMSGSPLVYDGLVVVNPGAQEGNSATRAVLAFRTSDGRLAWESERAMASYASPMLAELGGSRQVLIFDAQGLAALDPATGEPLWRHTWITDFDINAAQPVVLDGDRVFISSGAGCALLQIRFSEGAWQVEELWKNRNMKAAYANPLVHDGFVYGLDEGIMVCLDLESGQRRWKKGRHGHGQMLLAGDLIIVLSEQGQVILVEATPEAYRELGSFAAIEGRTWNNPILVDGVLYVRNHLEMAAYRLPLAE